MKVGKKKEKKERGAAAVAALGVITYILPGLRAVHYISPLK